MLVPNRRENMIFSSRTFQGCLDALCPYLPSTDAINRASLDPLRCIMEAWALGIDVLFVARLEIYHTNKKHSRFATQVIDTCNHIDLH